MTRTSRTKAQLEAKITELYVKLLRRKTTKVSRKINLKKRMEFFQGLLSEMIKSEAVVEPIESTPTTPSEK